jgi:hypothetical protein
MQVSATTGQGMDAWLEWMEVGARDGGDRSCRPSMRSKRRVAELEAKLAARMSGIRLELGADLAAPPVLAAGAWFKNAVCGLRLARRGCRAWSATSTRPKPASATKAEPMRCSGWLGTPAAIAHDLHPDFHSSRHAAETAARGSACQRAAGAAPPRAHRRGLRRAWPPWSA